MAETTAEKMKQNAHNIHNIGMAGKVVGMLVAIWLISISYYAFAFFAIGMLPATIAMIMDKGAGKFASQTIAACNFIGILPFLFDIGMNYEKSVAAKQIMLDPMSWLIIYGCSVIGLMLIFILPNIMAISYTLKAEYKLKKLISEQEALVEEWGDDVKDGK